MTDDVDYARNRGYEIPDWSGSGDYPVGHFLEGLSEGRSEVLTRLRGARANHPECTIHPDDDPVTCGWKRVVLDMDAVLKEYERETK